MKNLKTIIIALVLSFMALGCETNESLFETENLYSIDLQKLDYGSGNTNRAEDHEVLGTSILIEYTTNEDEGVKRIVRSLFRSQGLVFNFINDCGDDKETWIVEEISYESLSFMYSQILNGDRYQDNHRTVVVRDESGTGPKPGASFKMYYDGDCTSDIN